MLLYDCEMCNSVLPSQTAIFFVPKPHRSHEGELEQQHSQIDGKSTTYSENAYNYVTYLIRPYYDYLYFLTVDFSCRKKLIERTLIVVYLVPVVYTVDCVHAHPLPLLFSKKDLWVLSGSSVWLRRSDAVFQNHHGNNADIVFVG